MYTADITLSASDLTVGYGTTPLFPGVDLEARRGQLIGLLGANGAGKSTLLRTLAASQTPLGGTVYVKGVDTATCQPSQLARLISIVYTDRISAGGLTVREVVSLGRYPYTSALGHLSDADRACVDFALATVGIATMASRHLSRLSDGERQKAMIAKALAQDTPVILLDEPTTFLDVASRLEMFRLLRSLATDSGKTIIISTHEVAPLLSVATHLWLITHDHTIVTGPTPALIANGSLNALFPPGSTVAFSPERMDFTLT